MGYNISVKIDLVLIDRLGALAAINALFDERGRPNREHPTGGSSTGETWYGFAMNPPPGGYRSIEDALKAWRYPVAEDGRIHFSGEKWGGNEELLYVALAPFVSDGHIHIHGEDGYAWRYVFEDKKIFKTRGRPSVAWSVPEKL